MIPEKSPRYKPKQASLNLHHSATHTTKHYHPHHHSTHASLKFSFIMAVRAVATCSFFRPPSPPLLSSALRLFSSRFRCSGSLRHGAKIHGRSFHSVFDSVMEELHAARKSRHKRVSAAGSRYSTTLSLGRLIVISSISNKQL